MAITLLVALALGATVVGFFQPVIGLFGIGILCTLDAVARFFVLGSGVLPWNTFNYWLLIVMLVHAPLLLRFQPLPLQLLSLFFLVAGVQLLYSSEVVRGLQHLLGGVIVFGVLAYFLRGIRSDEAWIWLGLVCGVAAALGGLAYYVNKANLGYVNPNAAAYLPLTGLFAICLGFPFAHRHRWHQAALLLLAVANTGWIFLSGSRGALLIAVFCLLFLFYGTKGFSQRLMLILSGLLFVVIISARFSELKAYTMGRIEKMFKEDASLDARTSGRSDIVRVGWRIFLANPLGVGTGNFRPHYAKHSSQGYIEFKPGTEVDAHAGWIKTLAENGLPGIFLFGAFVASFAYVGWRRRKAGVFPIGLLVSVILAIAFISTEFQGKGLWLLTAGSLLVLSRRTRRVQVPEEIEGRVERVEVGTNGDANRNE